MSKRVCAEPGCPVLTDGGRCATHRRAADRARGTRQQRGYDSAYVAARQRWAPLVDSGLVKCWRCRAIINVGAAWHLGHSDDRAAINGPEHANCNLSAAGKARHGR